MLSEAELTCNVNQTVMISYTLRLCCSVAGHCASPHCREEQRTEWQEFFQPALQETLLTLFVKRCGEGGGGGRGEGERGLP